MPDDLDPQTWGEPTVLAPRQAAVRVPPPTAPAQPSAPEPGPILDGRGPQMLAFDPTTRKLTSLSNDPVLMQIQGLWRDRQAQGRQAYEAMLKHPEVESSFNAWLDFIASNAPHAKPQARSATPKQQELAAFANHLLARIPWTEFVNGPLACGFQFGFSLSELTAEVVRWQDRDYVSFASISVLPQASLDNGYVMREELGQLSLGRDPRYKCFKLDDRGGVEKVYQFYWMDNGGTNTVTWEGGDLERILHFVHRKGDGNPYGKSILYAAFYAWSDLYVLEKIESVFLDMALPVLIISYKAVDGVPRPALHTEIVNLLSQQEMSGTRRVLVLPDASGQSIAPSNENFTAHIGAKKAELRKYIRKAIGLPESLVAETNETDADARNVVQVFLKHTLKARLAEVSALLEDMLGRFIRANYRDLDDSDYPVIQWSIVTENEVRVAQALLAVIYQDLDVEKAPQVISRVFPFVEEDDFARTPDRRTSVVWPKKTADQPGINGVSNPPPQKEPGSQRERLDGQTDNPSGRNTSA